MNDGRPFWQFIVSSSTGCSDSQYFEELYNYYTTEKVKWSWFPFLFVNFCSASMITDSSINFPCFFVNLWKAWHLCDPEAEKVFKAIRKAGVKLAVVSNFDTRLRPVLRALNCDHWFDAVAVSAEVSELLRPIDISKVIWVKSQACENVLIFLHVTHCNWNNRFARSHVKDSLVFYLVDLVFQYTLNFSEIILFKKIY